ncbi:MAG: hypothetical protein J6I68_04715 [Butyrivibrio sp.]|uniref:hypothetical protein n=1 Tax=Butyrivibrio sp. TaxID=28121 RepID=UPI001B66AEA3|nr:hypothetical protein [Butyrivibrio sp.]MBP3782531.1 hypothetical protein [Butyrivibrio sp.]
MSNKMLWKRLLATGMSMAMAATLFATNSITTFAISDESGGDFIEAAPAEDAAAALSTEEEAEETPQEYKDDYPPFEDQEDYKETPMGEEYSYTKENKRDKTEHTESYQAVQVEKNEYYSDVNDVAENGAKGNENEYEKVERDQINKETDTIDYFEVKSEIVTDSTVYLIDTETKEKVQGQDAEGNEVDIALPGDFNKYDKKNGLVPVEVVVDEEGKIDELNLRDYYENQLIYGYYDDNGNFVETKNSHHDGVKTYIKNADGLTPTQTVYFYKDSKGKKIYVDEEVYKVLSGEESDKYTKIVEYTFENTVYSTDESANNTKEDLENNDKIKEVGDWDYTTKAVPEEKIENATAYTLAINTMVTVIGEPTDVGHKTATYPVEYYTYDRFGNQYIVRTTARLSKGLEVGAKAQASGFDKSKNVFKPGKSEETVNALVTVKDKEGNIVWAGTQEDYEAMKKAGPTTITEYQGMYKVELKQEDEESEPQYAYVEKKAYDTLRENITKYEVTTSYYYTVQDKNEAREVEVTIGDETYNLTVNFWQNKRIGITNVDVIYPEEGGDPYLAISYTYSGFDRFGRYEAKTGVLDNPELTTVTVDSFGSTGKGAMNIKYTPAYATFVMPEKDYPVKGEVIVAADYRTRAAMPSEFLMMLSDVPNFIPEKLDDVRVDGNWHRSNLFGPLVNIAPIEEPVPGPEPEEPTPTPERAPWITTAAIEETPVALAATVAPAGQVLGAQREEATGEAPAVLGASRARGTADETTAPFVRVLVMAAVASVALFLTRKREEEN